MLVAGIPDHQRNARSQINRRVRQQVGWLDQFLRREDGVNRGDAPACKLPCLPAHNRVWVLFDWRLEHFIEFYARSDKIALLFLDKPATSKCTKCIW